LHENEVPDFNIAATITGKVTVCVTLLGCFRAHVVVDFAAWPARAGVAHGPKIVFHSEAKDAFGWHPLTKPEFLRLFVRRQFKFRKIGTLKNRCI
jgi:hypothetical protein